MGLPRKSFFVLNLAPWTLPGRPETGVYSRPNQRGRAMPIHSPTVVATHDRVTELDRLGDEIAELSAHLDAATARLLELIREFDARGGWNNGFPSCAAWLTWRIGLAPGAAREHVRVARALATLPRLARALTCGELSYTRSGS
jgi:hypothetical protein